MLEWISGLRRSTAVYKVKHVEKDKKDLSCILHMDHDAAAVDDDDVDAWFANDFPYVFFINVIGGKQACVCVYIYPCVCVCMK